MRGGWQVDDDEPAAIPYKKPTAMLSAYQLSGDFYGFRQMNFTHTPALPRQSQFPSADLMKPCDTQDSTHEFSARMARESRRPPTESRFRFLTETLFRWADGDLPAKYGINAAEHTTPERTIRTSLPASDMMRCRNGDLTIYALACMALFVFNVQIDIVDDIVEL